MTTSHEAKTFLDARDRALTALTHACQTNEVDTQILPLLTQVNTNPHYYTLSSCAGRILLLQLPAIGDKRHAVFLGCWHQPINIDDVTTALQQATTGTIWLLAQAPIIHLGTDTLQAAETMVKNGNSAGFKNSAIRSLGKRIIIELASTERLDTPIGLDTTCYCPPAYLSLLITISNEVLQRSAEKLIRLQTLLRTIL